MAWSENFHSRLVLWAKITLPLVALGLLSTLFLFARSSNTTNEIPLAELDALARDQVITAPTFSGMTPDGSILTVTASRAQPESMDMSSLTIRSPKLVMKSSDGTNLTIDASEGSVDTAQNTAMLGGLARLETSTGYLMETKDLIVDLSTGSIRSLGPLAVIAPFGTLDAGLLRIELGENEQGQQMHFTNGVRMLYDPSKVTD